MNTLVRLLLVNIPMEARGARHALRLAARGTATSSTIDIRRHARADGPTLDTLDVTGLGPVFDLERAQGPLVERRTPVYRHGSTGLDVLGGVSASCVVSKAVVQATTFRPVPHSTPAYMRALRLICTSSRPAQRASLAYRSIQLRARIRRSRDTRGDGVHTDLALLCTVRNGAGVFSL